MKKLLGLILALMVLMSASAFAAVPDYVNMDSTLPFVKEGEEINLKIMCVYDQGATGDPAERWFFDFLQEFGNINVDFEIISKDAFNERKSLMFASAELPDMIFGNFSNSEIVRYGMVDGLLMNFNEYLDVMPNMSAAFEANEGLAEYLTLPDGGIYAQGRVSFNPEISFMPRLFSNMGWARELGLEMPKTLDEFVAMLYAFKDNAEKLGVEDMVPLAGGYNVQNPLGIILQAMGFNGDATDGKNSNGFTMSVKDGEYIYPIMHKDFAEYLKLANQMYKDGILCSDYFTLDQTTYNAELSAGNYGYVAGAVHAFTTVPEVILNFEAQQPMTSQWNDTPKTSYKGHFSIGDVFVCGNTKYPEVCARICDAYWDETIASYFWPGPVHGSEYAMGYNGLLYTDEDGDKNWTKTFPGQPEGTSEWNAALSTWHNRQITAGLYGTIEAKTQHIMSQGVAREDIVMYTIFDDEFWIPLSGGNHLNKTVVSNILPYHEYINYNVWLTEEESVMVSDLETVLKPYIDEQVARFIAGERSLDEVEQFQKELEGMGIRDLEALYAAKMAG